MTNRKKMKSEIKITTLLVTFALFVACTDEVLLSDDIGMDDGTYETYLSLIVRCPKATVDGVQTRSNPTGGENSDGHEPGQEYETRIDDLMLLFYQGERGGEFAGLNSNRQDYISRPR